MTDLDRFHETLRAALVDAFTRGQMLPNEILAAIAPIVDGLYRELAAIRLLTYNPQMSIAENQEAFEYRARKADAALRRARGEGDG